MTNSLFEKYLLCDEGFGNIYDRNHPDDPPIGFQLKSESRITVLPAYP